MTTTDGRIVALDARIRRGTPDAVRFALGAATALDQDRLVRADVYRVRGVVGLKSPDLRPVLPSAEAPEFTVQQWAAFLVGSYVSDAALRAAALPEEDLRWNVIASRREVEVVHPEVRGMLEALRLEDGDHPSLTRALGRHAHPEGAQACAGCAAGVAPPTVTSMPVGAFCRTSGPVTARMRRRHEAARSTITARQPGRTLHARNVPFRPTRASRPQEAFRCSPATTCPVLSGPRALVWGTPGPLRCRA